MNRDNLLPPMSKSRAPLEKELKYFLTKKDYDTLLKASRKNIKKSVKQTNFYFDDKDLNLRKRRIGLRVRFENNSRCTLTLKEPSNQRSSKLPKLKIRREWEVDLPLLLGKRLVKGQTSISSLSAKPIQILKKYFSQSELEAIHPLGSVKTVRTFVLGDKKTLLEIDKFKMFQRKFYELEVETDRPLAADQVVRALLKNHGIAYRPITKSKLGRFVELLKKKRRR